MRTKGVQGDARLLPPPTTSAVTLGLGSGDRFEGRQGGSGSIKEGVPLGRKPAELRGKRSTKRDSRSHSRRAQPHGKEGVDGSSPSEGFTKGQQSASFVAFRGARRPENLSPRSVPKRRSTSKLWLEPAPGGTQSTSALGRCSSSTKCSGGGDFREPPQPGAPRLLRACGRRRGSYSITRRQATAAGNRSYSGSSALASS
jgi:hypothetical protein